MPDLHVICHRPGGMHRAGLRHERHKAHPADAFTAGQLREMFEDPEFTVIVGGDKLTEAQVAQAEAAEKAAAKKAKA